MKNIKNRITRIILLACVSLTLTAANAQAATWTVTKTADTADGVCNADCSLREAIDVAATGDIINFSSLFNTPQTITLTNGQLSITEGLDIVGTGADLLTVSGNNTSIVFFTFSLNVTVNLSGMTITGSDESGIFNVTGVLAIDGCVITGNDESGIKNSGTLTVNNSTISENTGDSGGGIYNDGSLTITNSTISNNTANDTDSGSGGIYQADSLSSLTVINSTISGNAKLGDDYNGGGIFNQGSFGVTITNCTITNNSADGANSASGVFGRASVLNTIIAANVNNSTQPDVAGTSSTTSGGYNLIGNVGSASVFTNLGDQTGTSASPLNPLLDPLGDYGGMTATHRLQTNSPAIDKGSSFGSTEDQRDYLRPFDKTNIPNTLDGSDIGAYELQFAVVVSGFVFRPPGDPLKNARVLLRAANGGVRAVKTDRFGVYRFKNVARNRIYQVSVTHRQFEFTPQIIMVQEENINNLNFTALP